MEAGVRSHPKESLARDSEATSNILLVRDSIRRLGSSYKSGVLECGSSSWRLHGLEKPMHAPMELQVFGLTHHPMCEESRGRIGRLTAGRTSQGTKQSNKRRAD